MYAITDYLAGSLITHDVILLLMQSAQPGPSQRISVMTTAAVDLRCCAEGRETFPGLGPILRGARGLKEVSSAFVRVCVLGRVSHCSERRVYKSDCPRQA